jgi:hypothetical protein
MLSIYKFQNGIHRQLNEYEKALIYDGATIGYQKKLTTNYARAFFGGNIKDFTKATYLALANVMKLLRIGIKAGNGYRTEEL